MSKADQLGSGRFGGGVRTVSARRQAVAAATGVPTEGIAPPTELPVNRISLNPDNPRSTLGDLTDLAGSLKTHGQKQAVTVMNRDAYVKANPEREADLEPDTTHVVVDGSSRLAAAREAGLDTLAVMVSDNQGSTPEELLESALVANIHRQALEELDEARALQRLLEIHGSQRALAKRLHRSQGWVSQRLALLNLTPELQARIGQEPIDLLRAVGNKPVEHQAAALDELKAERAAKEAARTSSRRATRQTSDTGEDTTSSPGSDYDVITDSAEGDSANNSQGARATDEGRTVSSAAAAADLVPEPRADSASPKDREASREQQARRVPFDKPGELALLLDVRVKTNDDFFALLRLLHSKALDRDPARAGELARSFAEHAAERTV
ncbi:ParB/RepB/Spo0J family partition protein [Streptomyces capillispiralis]|uniref:ParB family chromosome partitioning protein n=1 Tax=Streptomyces capillispiralis TaxID=68182 RepID=A0A561SGE7_9ACTN|nr:ParB/RepB/Spo0J family partition protein [Streptomyces capillispiralis]TWF73944.1 ParB family chromosome partitioning protein [Streptomyces capillispiralis]GHE24410.1 plasmid partitioning protein [Streptomyces capillispiralis]